MKHIKSTDFESEVLRADVPVLVDFYTEHCQPCRFMSPLIEEIEQESSGRLKVVKIDAASEPEFTASFRVTSVPTFFLFHGGQRVAQFTGARGKKDLKRWIDESITQKA